MQYFCSFTSGSKGNSAIYVEGSTKILIDAGTNAKYISSCLSTLGLTPKDLTHVVITHAHSDHISALPVLLKHSTAQLVCTEGTYSQMKIDVNNPLLFWEGESFVLGDVAIATAATPHDCMGSCCYSFGLGDEGIAYCTDLGRMTDDIFALLSSKKTVFLESNHDVDMLRTGPYPYFLKQRVLSGVGHLSNVDCADAVSRLAAQGTEHVILGHLSETNNMPRIAISETEAALHKIGASQSVLLGAAAARSMLQPVGL